MHFSKHPTVFQTIAQIQFLPPPLTAQFLDFYGYPWCSNFKSIYGNFWDFVTSDIYKNSYSCWHPLSRRVQGSQMIKSQSWHLYLHQLLLVCVCMYVRGKADVGESCSRIHHFHEYCLLQYPWPTCEFYQLIKLSHSQLFCLALSFCIICGICSLASNST